MRTKTLLKQDPAKPNAALDANTAWRTGMDSSSLNRGRLGSSVRMSMTVSEEEDAAAMRDSCSSSTIETAPMPESARPICEGCGGVRVWVGGCGGWIDGERGWGSAEWDAGCGEGEVGAGGGVGRTERLT